MGSEEAGEDESDEHAARYQCVAEGEGNPGYVMRSVASSGVARGYF